MGVVDENHALRCAQGRATQTGSDTQRADFNRERCNLGARLVHRL